MQRAKEFLSNLRGVAFYAVPHAGSRNFGEYVKKLFRYNIRHYPVRHYPRIIDNIQP
jgi:hypothetical protein